jgi:hypothetical protein
MRRGEERACGSDFSRTGGANAQRSRTRDLFSFLTHHASRITHYRLALLLLATFNAQALTIEHERASYHDKHYEFELVALLDAPADRVEAVLRDYEGYKELDPRILEVHVVDRPESYVTMLQTTLHVCFGPFCRNVKRLERVEEAPLQLSAIADPAHSDVKFGETRMKMSVTEGRTRISYHTSIVPDFWIPAFAGRRWLLNTLADGTTDLFRQVERKAQEENE